MDSLLDRLNRQFESMRSARVTWESLWQELANYAMPRKAGITAITDTPSTTREQFLFDGTAVRANRILANGSMAWLTPMESPWFSFDVDARAKGMATDRTKNWLSDCTETARWILSNSNFYTEIHEAYLDRGCFGTAALMIDSDQDHYLHFASHAPGSYMVAENSRGYVDRIAEEKIMTIQQMVDEFGLESLPMKLQAKYRDNAEGRHDKVTVRHMVMPNEPWMKLDLMQAFPIASVWWTMDEKHMLRSSGYWEMPLLVTRYLRWTGYGLERTPYGYSPAWEALPDTKQTQFLSRMMDALAELKAFPPVLAPDDMDHDDIGIRSGDVTYFSDATKIPRFWEHRGEYNIGLERIQAKQEAIREAFHVDLFQMFAALDKQMTAREVMERSSEKLIQFSPTFARLTTELFIPMLRRVFGILFRAGVMPDPPPEALVDNGDGTGSVMLPSVTFSSRVAYALKGLNNLSTIQTLDSWGPVLEVRPELLDNLELDDAFRDFARNNGTPANLITPEEKRDQMRQARAEQQARMEQAALAQAGADAAAKLGGIPNDSPVAENLRNARDLMPT